MSVVRDLFLAFFTALGVVLGGCIVGSFAAVFSRGSPVHTMLVLAKPIKLWAIVVAIGGTIPTIRAFDSGIWYGEIRLIFQQLAMIISGFLGASVGYWLVNALAGVE